MNSENINNEGIIISGGNVTITNLVNGNNAQIKIGELENNAPAKDIPDSQETQLKQELQLLNQIDEVLINDKDTIVADEKLRQWKKRVTSLIGCPDLYDIQPDQNQKTPYNQTRNVIKQSRRFVKARLKKLANFAT